MKTILQSLHNSHVYFSFLSFGDVAEKYFEFFSPKCTYIMEDKMKRSNFKKPKQKMFTKFTNTFLFVSFIAEIDFSVTNPKELDSIYWGYRDPYAALYISSHFEASIFQGFRIKPTILALTLKSVHLICPICQKLDWELTSLENLDMSWRQIFTTRGSTIYMNNFVHTVDTQKCNLFVYRSGAHFQNQQMYVRTFNFVIFSDPHFSFMTD